MIISPFYQIAENNILFTVEGVNYIANTEENTIIVAEGVEAPVAFNNLVEALKVFKFENNEITWYHGISKMRYSVSEGKFFLGNSEIIAESFVNHILAAGVVRYEDHSTATLFTEAAKGIESLMALDFVFNASGKGNRINLMVMEGNVYIAHLNETTRLFKFTEASSANSALEFVSEKTGVDATEFLADLLEGEAAERVVTINNIKELSEMVSFLKDQRGLLADADRSIEEIKAADALIEGEIARVEKEIETAKSAL